MNSDKAYLLGLIIGGGHFNSSSDTFLIKLPYMQWGDLAKNPERAGKISRDIMHVMKPMFKEVYNLDISYDTSPRKWIVSCYGDLASVKNDLITYGIIPQGEIRKNLSILGIVKDLIDDNLKRRFIAGLADTIGSTAKSHRRFSDDVQIISFEINGFQFEFVCELCRLLYSIKCYPDQILWNHPNFHCTQNPYYTQWKKGFKLRVKLEQYAKFGAFAFKAKVISANENIELQSKETSALPCEDRKVSAKIACVHKDEWSNKFPQKINGGHYLHNKHVCAVLGCDHAPYDQVNNLINKAHLYISPFPILAKGEFSEISSIISSEQIMSNRNYREKVVDIEEIFNLYKEAPNLLLYGTNKYNGYSVSILIQAIAFLIAANTNKLNGMRISGKYINIVEEHIKSQNNLSVIMKIPDLLTPIILTDNSYSALVGPIIPSVCKKLITKDEKNPYKIYVRQIEESDLSES